MRCTALFVGLVLLTSSAAAQETPREPPEARPGPPPIMVVVLPSGRIAPEIVTAIQQAMVEQIGAMSGGRPVHALAAPELLTAISRCSDDACIGAILASANAQAGAIVRLRARGRQLRTTIELRDPVSGAPRLEPIRGEIPADAAQVGTASSALTAQLSDAMPSPPPPPSTILVTVNVDGASVRIDGEEVGTSPVAAVEVSEGAHEVFVTMSGHQSMRRRVEVRPSEQERVDITLSEMGAVTADTGAESGDGDEGFFEPRREESGGDVTSEWWFWTAIGAGAAVLIGLAIGIGVAIGTSGEEQPPPDPMGIPLPPIEGGM